MYVTLVRRAALGKPRRLNAHQRDLVEALAYFQITPRQESEPVKLLGE